MKAAVIAHPETAQGFRLVGFEVHPAHSPEEARAHLEALVQKGEYALVAVEGSLLPEPEKAAERARRGRDLPVILSIAGFREVYENPDVEAYLRGLVRATLGFDVKL